MGLVDKLGCYKVSWLFRDKYEEINNQFQNHLVPKEANEVCSRNVYMKFKFTDINY